MYRLVFCCFLVLLTLLPSLPHARELNEADARHARDAFLFAEKQDWDNALAHARRGSNPLLYKVVFWRYLLNKGSGATFAEITDFIRRNPHWPEQKKLLQRAEESLASEAYADADVKRWFATHPPFTGMGKIALAEIMDREGGKDYYNLLQEGWLQGDFDESTERRILAKFGSALTSEHHIRRIDRLLWDEQVNDAMDLFDQIPNDYEALFTARAALIRDEPDAASKVNRVPNTLKNDIGLMFDRMAWRSRHGSSEGVREILLQVKGEVPYPEKWWPYREEQVREALQEEDYNLAAHLAERHGQKDGQERMEALWLAGWIKLSFLKQPDAAYKDFYALHQAANFPVSKARGAYWAGRAAEKNGNTDIAANWYAQAMSYPTTFYGQAAAARAGENIQLPAPPVITAVEKEAFSRKELPCVVALLFEADQDDLANRMLGYMADSAASAQEAALAASFAHSLGQPAAGVKTAKKAGQNGYVLIDSGYPRFTTPTLVEKPLILALARQESEFDRKAKSPAGALGLMQLLPSTGKEIAKKAGLSFSIHRLYESQYNMELGSLYIERLVNRFDGSYVMAIAAYNAGPGRVGQWRQSMGIPRRNMDEMIDWIESIPFSETRNYVQRVMENLQVYRLLLKGGELKFKEDLLR